MEIEAEGAPFHFALSEVMRTSALYSFFYYYYKSAIFQLKINNN